MTKQYREVLRPFDGNGTRYQSGDIVEVSTWKHVHKLVATRYLSSFLVKQGQNEPQEAKAEEPKKTTATKKVAKPTTDVE